MLIAAILPVTSFDIKSHNVRKGMLAIENDTLVCLILLAGINWKLFFDFEIENYRMTIIVNPLSLFF